MERNQRPHSREKKVGSGSASVGKGRKIENGSRPVGFGGRKPEGSGSNRGYGSSQSFGQGTGGMSYTGGRKKKSLFGSLGGIILVIIVILFLTRSCGGGASLSDYSGSDTAGSSGNTYSSSYGGNYGNDYSDFGSFGNTGSFGSFGNFGGNDYSYTSSYTQPNLAVSEFARPKRVTPIGNGNDVVTIMLYMCGTDLESRSGMATRDLQEMLNATISDKVNLIIETGGCSRWQNNVISSSANQIYKVERGGLKCLKQNAGNAAMTDPANLTQFIKFCTANYPADRNMLIFWDHGGGSLSGYGYDEKNKSSGSMTLSKIDRALSNAGCVFDFIGFDACLMATLETDLVCEKYADYLIGSEETEPGTGWYYTNWLSRLSENTSMSTLDISANIIDDYASTASSGGSMTLSVVDLAELHGTVPEVFREFSKSTTDMIRSGDYKTVSDARAGVRQFAQSNKINQVDMIDLAERIGTDEARALAEALRGCVKYNRSRLSRCFGVSIYFPYETTSSVNTAITSYKELGIDEEYTKCIQSFASLEYAGQVSGSASQSDWGGYSSGSGYGSLFGSGSPIGSLTGSYGGSAGSGLDMATILDLLGSFSGRNMPQDYKWIDADLISDQAMNIAENTIDPSRLKAVKNGDRNVLKLTDDEWALIQTVELNLFADDGDGYIDLGLDNTFEWYEDDLLLEYDGTWLTLNGNVCAYYLESDTQMDSGTWVTIGRIPALLNGRNVELKVIFDELHPDGYVSGAYPVYDEDETDVQSKGNIEILPGDEIELLCDYYDLDGSYSTSYTLGTKFRVPEEGLELCNLKLDTQDVIASYRLTDIYGNHYWVPID